MTERDVTRDVLAERFRRAADRGDVRVLDMPAGVSVRLHVGSRIDGLCCWLVEHGQSRAAVLIWKACRLW